MVNEIAPSAICLLPPTAQPSAREALGPPAGRGWPTLISFIQASNPHEGAIHRVAADHSQPGAKFGPRVHWRSTKATLIDKGALLQRTPYMTQD